LENAEIVKIQSELLKLIAAGLSMHSADLFPYSVNISNLVGQQFLVAKAFHDSLDLYIAASEEKLYALLDLCLALGEVVVKLLNKLFTLFQSLDVPLSSGVSLGLNHYATLL
jgi:hypothetical protein